LAPLAVARQYYNGFVESDKSSMPVDVLKLLEAKDKDVMSWHVDMAAKINIGDGSAFWAALVVEQIREHTRKQGLDMYFIQNKTLVDCSLVETTAGSWMTKLFKSPEKKCYEISDYIEYYDMDYTHMQYRPPMRYPKERLLQYQDCMNGRGRKMRDNANQYMLDVYLPVFKEEEFKPRLPATKGCSASIAGAVGREKSHGCKCPGDDMSIFCGKKKVADRKFDSTKLPSCQAGLYCAEKACRMPDW